MVSGYEPPKLTKLFWNNMLQQLGSNPSEVPLPGIRIDNYGRSFFNDHEYIITLGSAERFGELTFFTSFSHEGTHAIHWKLSNGAYNSTPRREAIDRGILDEMLLDENKLVDYYKKLVWCEGLAYRVQEFVMDGYMKMKNYFVDGRNRRYAVAPAGKGVWHKELIKADLKGGKLEGSYPDDAPVENLELATMDSIASIVGYCCVRQLEPSLIKSLIRDNNAHLSSDLYFNSRYPKHVERDIRELVACYLKDGRYFSGLVTDALRDSVPGMELS